MTDTFSRIDAYKLRVIGVSVSPRPEVSPGDTVTITAYFGGNDVVSVSDVTIAHNIVDGTDGAVPRDAYPAALISSPRGMPDSAIFSFVVNEDVFIGRQGLDSVKQSLSDSVGRMFMKPKDSVSAMIAGLSDSQRDTLGSLVNKMVLPAGVLFTARSANGATLRVLSRFFIKYHPELIARTPPNNNPDVSWAGICTVPDTSALGFSPFDPAARGKFTMTYLYNRHNPAQCDSVILIDTGYAYFLVADNGISERIDSTGAMHIDTSWEYLVNEDGSRRYATYQYHWFYQNVDAASDDDDSAMVQIQDAPSACLEMKPPRDIAMKRFRVWVALSAEMPYRWSSLKGTCVRRLHGEFKFTDAYKEWSSEQ